ncbi:uncharacterized protein [Triticum aestivum]|uniref:uncharacterized protein n=1 Tax=Triticum aestivum TaxID=4565 RepID=UPI001D02B805|nr:uncharacterized protein LOC123188591 [Triticum aestivum]
MKESGGNEDEHVGTQRHRRPCCDRPQHQEGVTLSCLYIIPTTPAASLLHLDSMGFDELVALLKVHIVMPNMSGGRECQGWRETWHLPRAGPTCHRHRGLSGAA